MLLFRVILVAGTLVSFGCKKPDEASLKIVNGFEIHSNDPDPLRVMIRRAMVLVHSQISANNFGQCSGSVITSKHILTAGHCVAALDKKSNTFKLHGKIWIGLGTNEGSEQAMDVIETILHPKYNLDTDGHRNRLQPEHDIAILKLRQTLPAESQSIALFDGTSMPSETVAVIAGYGGAERVEGVLPEVQPLPYGQLRMVTMPEPSYSWYFKTFHFTWHKGSCPGDSGGPSFFYNRKARTLFQFGVSNRGRCGERATYTAVAPYLTWIESVVGKVLTNGGAIPDFGGNH